MNNKKNKILTFGKASCLIWSLIVLAIAVSIVIFVARLKRDHIETATDQIINPTPTLIRSMQNIGAQDHPRMAYSKERHPLCTDTAHRTARQQFY